MLCHHCHALSPLLDQSRLRFAIFYFYMDHFYQKLVSWTWSLFGPDVGHLKFGRDPLHTKAVCCNVYPHIMVASHDMACVFVVLVTVSHGYGAFAVKVDGSIFH